MVELKLSFNRFVAILFLSILFPLCIYATPLLEIMLPDQTSIYELNLLGLDEIERRENSAIVVGWPHDLPGINQSGLAYRIENENIEEFYRSRLTTSTGLDELDDMGGYATVEELYQQAIEIAEAYPDIVAGPDTIGYTLENRPIWVLKISDNVNVDEDEGEIFINGCIHAREVITPLIIMNLADILTSEYETNPRITEIVNGREVWLMPVINVDGYVYNEEQSPDGGGMWRKNKRTVNEALRGVDLNRNFPTAWGLDNLGSSPSPSSEVYRGESAGSEPATQVVMAFCNAHNFSISINYHAYMNTVLMPVSYNLTSSINGEAHRRLIEQYVEPLGWQIINPKYHGNVPDWMVIDADNYIFSMLSEVGGDMDGFWPSLDRQPILIEEQEEPLLLMCEAAENPFQYLPPEPPLVYQLPDTVGVEFALSWNESTEDLNNPAEFYEVLSLENRTSVDNVELENNPTWKTIGFDRSTVEAYSGEYAYTSINRRSQVHFLVSREEYLIQQDDTLRFWTKYNLSDMEILYVQIDAGWITFALEGNITQPTGSTEFSLAHEITGLTDEWVLAEFPLASYAGYSVRFQLKHLGGLQEGNVGVAIDDISPVKTWENIEVLESGITDTTFVMNLTGVTQEGEFTFGVRAHDIHGDIGLPSNGVTTYFDPDYVDVGEAALPEEFRVGDAYPNPFNPSTTLRVSLPTVGQLTVSVHDILGRQVDFINKGNVSAGRQTVNLNGNDWASGLYFIKVDFTGSNGSHHSDIQKAMLIK
jgi:Zinc carboxypeptidase/Secretion system C-terminal sorting domain